MWYQPCTREALLAILGGAKPEAMLLNRPLDRGVSIIPSTELILFWRTKPEDNPSHPHAILAADYADFVAWASTYLSTFRPVTGFFRVLTANDFELFLSDPNDIGSHGLANVFAGLILAEAYLRSMQEATDTTITSLGTLPTTCSFAVARTFALRCERAYTNIIDRWRHLMAQIHSSSPYADQMSEIWNCIAAMSGMSAPSERELLLVAACREIREAGHIRKESWHLLSRCLPDVVDADARLLNARELRVTRLDNVVESILSTDIPDPVITAFVIGYLFSQIAPGTLDHLHLTRRVTAKLPGAVMWYGLCAGLYPHTAVQDFRNGLVRRALRDIEAWEPFVERPRSDISLGELSASGVTNTQELLRRRSLVVELAPRIYTVIGRSTLSTAATPNESVDPSALAELGHYLDRATNVYRRLSQTRTMQDTLRFKKADTKKPKPGRRLTK